MPSTAFSADFLTGYDLVLTPNIRSARQLEAAGAQAIEVVPWHGWTASLWQRFILEGAEDRILLNEAQVACLWEQVLADIGPAVLRPVRSMVNLCMEAYRLLCGHLALDRLLDYAGETESDSGAFAGWLQEFERRCRRKQWITPAALEMHAAAVLRSGRGGNSYRGLRCLAYGFGQLRPAQEQLLQVLQIAGATVDRLPAHAPQSQAPTLLSCTNTETEFRHITQSLKQVLEQGTQSISLVLPSYSESRGRLERELRACFEADAHLAASSTRSLWEFSEGVPLSSVSMARHALVLLDWLSQAQQPDDVSQLLRSPYLQLGIEVEDAGRLDARVLQDRERVRPEWSLASLIWQVEQSKPALAARLRSLQNFAPYAHIRRSHGDWVQEVRSILTAAGWPGTRGRTSNEFQTVERWDDLLDQITTLDAVSPPLPYPEFLRTFRHLAEKTLFSPQNTGAPIQIMSPSESEGSTAELLWFASAGEQQWNSKRPPHPLLPYTLQKEFDMPGTDAIRDSVQGNQTTQRIVQSASRAIFSYSSAEKDATVKPSTLVTSLPDLIVQSGFGHQASDVQRPAVELVDFVDDLPLPELDGAAVSGGVSILQHQAACAFRAFAERRLFSSELGTVDLGLEARERGSVLHTALQVFWNNIGSQSELHRHMHEKTLEAELERAVNEALAQLANNEPWAAAYLDVQRERLIKVLRAWMHYEAERPPFQVLHTEHTVNDVEVGPLRMKVRVDRIDQVNDQGQPALVLIDYKTGSPDIKGWLGERPAEPQMPLYAVSAGLENVQAIAFATVKPGRKHLGLHAFPQKTPLLFSNGKDADELAFELQLPEWRDTLERLAHDFASGRADVGPKEYPATCQWCAQRMLCRLNPELLEELAEEDEDAEITV